MTNKIKKTLSVLLSVLMLLSVVPLTAFAAGPVSLSGIFLYEGTSNPVVNQTVALRDDDMNVLATTKTNAAGEFTFAAEHSTSYYITVENGPAYADDEEYKEDNAYFALTTSSSSSTFFKGGTTKYLKVSVGTINFTKYVDGTTQPLANAVYELLNSDNDVIGTYTTDATGKFSATNIPFGSYKLREKTAPDGYFKNEESNAKNANITKNGDVVNVTDTDVAKCEITLVKTDSITSNPLPNATFKLEKLNGTAYDEISTYTTDNNGKIEVTSLVPGTYKFTETSAPEGYVVEQAEYEAVLTSAQPKATIYATNVPCPKITVTKLDSDTDAFVPGAVMKIVNAADNSDVFVFDTLDSVAQVYLVPGDYKLVEVTAPKGYIKGDDVAFTAVAGHDDTITMYEDARSLIINKFGEDINGTYSHDSNGKTKTYSPLNGVSYSIELQNATASPIVINNADSTCVIPYIEAGEYKIYETSHPDYYIADAAGVDVIVSENGKFTTVNIYNDYVQYPVVFEKKNADNEALNASFNLSGPFDTNVDFEAGSYSVNLCPGTYTLSETAAPAGYTTIDDAIIEVALDGKIKYNNNELTSNTVTIIDKPITLQVNKIDSETHEVIAGAVMKIEKTDGSYTKEFTTESTPTLITKELTPGDYVLTEVSAPYGYGVAAPVNFTIIDTDATQNVIMNDQRLTGSVIISKEGDSFDNVSQREIIAGYVENFFNTVADVLGLPTRPISGVEFTIYADEDINHPDGHTGLIYAKDDVVAVVETNNSGYVTVNNLPFGKYRVVETNAPVEFIEDSTAKYFTIDEDHGLVKPEEVDAYNATRTLTISVDKKDNYGNSLDDVVFGVYNANDINSSAGVCVLTKDSLVATLKTVNGVDSKTLNLPLGQYYLKEEIVPDGYIKDNNIYDIDFSDSNADFNKNATNMTFNFDIVNNAITIDIDKLDNVSNDKMADVKLQLIDANGNVYEEWTTDGTSHRIIAVPAGEYVIREDSSQIIPGYTLANDVNITVEATKDVQTFVIKNNRQLGQIIINKTIKGTTEPLANVTFNVHDDTNNVDIGNYTTDSTGIITVDNLPIAVYENGKAIKNITYTVTEVSTPAGYISADAQTITFNDLDATKDFYHQFIRNLSFENDYTKVVVSKYIKGTTDLLADVYYSLYSEENYNADLSLKDNAVPYAEWRTSSTESFVIEKIPAGKYLLVENTAPDGYIIADVKELVIENTADVQFFSVENDYTKVSIAKLDKTTNSYLENAELGLFLASDIENNAVKEGATPIYTWTTADEANVFNCLPAGDYAIVELTAPDGYVTAAPEFITVESTPELQSFIMYNDYTRVVFNKIDKESQEALEGAEFALYRKEDVQQAIDDMMSVFADIETAIDNAQTDEEKLAIVEELRNQLFEDPASLFTVPVPVAEWTSSKDAYYIDKLPIGEYLLFEISTPEGYIMGGDSDIETLLNITIPEDIADLIDASYSYSNSGVYYINVQSTTEQQTFTIENDYTKIDILKIDEKTEKPVAGAHLSLYKAEDVDELGTPYDDATPIDAWVSDDNAHRINKLPVGEYVLVETEAPEGYVLGKAATIKIDETAEVQLFKYSNVEKPLEEIVPEKPDIPKTGVETASYIIVFIVLMMIVVFVLPKSKKQFLSK